MPKSILTLTSKACVALLLAVLCAKSFAQYDNGSLVGTIKDATGAPIAGAAVTITNTATAIATEVRTNASGGYEVPSLRVGIYNVTASATGFSAAEAHNIAISVGGRQRIDLTLAVGATSTTVEVSDVALQVETENSQRDQTITNYQSEAFPLVTRNYSDLLALVPGSRIAPGEVTSTSVSSLERAGSYNVNGERSMFNNFLLDGIDNNAYGESNQGFDNQIIAIPPDSVAQFSIVTNNESAEYGRSSGATINVSSQSGTNAFHAALYDFIRNTDLNAAGFFKPTLVGGSGITQPFVKSTFNRNQFGANVGGPVLKDRLFFFLDYEGFRQVLRPLTVYSLPSQNELQGILTVAVKDPENPAVTYAAGTQIPTSAFDTVSKQIVQAFESSLCPKLISGSGSTACALPQSGLAAGGLAQNDYAVEAPFSDDSDKGDLRLDFQQSPNSSWFLRISDRKENAINFPTIPLPLDGQQNGNIRILDQQIALGYTHLFGANKVLDARLGLDRTKAGKYTLSIGQNSIVIPNLPTNPVVAGGLPTINITNFTGFGRQSTNPQWQDPALIDPKVNYTWVKGSHTLKFGYEYEHIWMAVNDNNPLFGLFAFAASSSTGGATSADGDWADFLFGNSSQYQLANFYEAHLTQNIHNIYAQDDWKVLPNLTVNVGLRWEYGSPYADLYNRISNWDPGSQTVFTTTPGAVAGNGITPVSYGGVYGQTLVHPDNTDFGPRLGFSYGINPKTVLRGGFGISYAHYTRAGSGDILAINAPQAQFASVSQTPINTSTTTAQPACPGSTPPAQIITPGTTTPSCYAKVEQGFPSGLVTTFNKATDNITWVPANTKDSYVESYYLSIQEQLFKNSLIDIAYVGNHGVKLQGFVNGNERVPSQGFARPFNNWPSDITEALNEFYSHFDSLQVKYEQRFVAGLTLLNSFTWEHALDNASASLEGITPSPQDGTNIAADYAQSDYNLPIANVTSLVYELPFGHGRRFGNDANGLVDELIGGWQLSAINTAQAGTPFDVVYSPNSNQYASTQITASYRGLNLYRPDRVPGVPVTQGRNSRAANTGYVNYVNLNAFVLPPNKDASGNYLSPFGTSSRNPGRTPAFYETNLSINKKFSTPIESLKVEFRTEFYNIFNHTNLYLPGGTSPSTLSGTAGTTPTTYGVGGTVPLGNIVGGVPTGGGTITSTFEPRIIQFGLKILY